MYLGGRIRLDSDYDQPEHCRVAGVSCAGGARDDNRQLSIFKFRLVQRTELITSGRAKPSIKESQHWPLQHSGEVSERTETAGVGQEVRIRINITALYAFIPPPAPASILTVV